MLPARLEGFARMDLSSTASRRSSFLSSSPPTVHSIWCRIIIIIILSCLVTRFKLEDLIDPAQYQRTSLYSYQVLTRNRVTNFPNSASMSTMNAVRFHGQRDIRLDQIPIPQVKPGHVKISPKFCGICGSDLHEYLGGANLIPEKNPHPITGETLPLTLATNSPVSSKKSAKASRTSPRAIASASSRPSTTATVARAGAAWSTAATRTALLV